MIDVGRRNELHVRMDAWLAELEKAPADVQGVALTTIELVMGDAGIKMITGGLESQAAARAHPSNEPRLS